MNSPYKNNHDSTYFERRIPKKKYKGLLTTLPYQNTYEFRKAMTKYFIRPEVKTLDGLITSIGLTLDDWAVYSTLLDFKKVMDEAIKTIDRLSDKLLNDKVTITILVREYFDLCLANDKIPSIADFCIFFKISKEKFNELCKSTTVGEIFTLSKIKIEHIILNGGTLEEFNSSITSLNLKNNFGYSDKISTENTGTVQIIDDIH